MARGACVDISVAVPRGVNGAITVARALASAAQGEGLPEPIEEALAALAAAREVLEEAAMRRHGAEPRPDRAGAASLHQAAWRAFERWASAWVEGPLGAAEQERAARILAVVRSDGMALQRLGPGEAWVEAGHRVARLAPLADDLATLGGEPFLRAVEATHAALGEAAGVTKPAPEPLPSLREPLDALREAVKALVLQVAAHGARGPEAAALAARLLAPLVGQTRRPRGVRRARGAASTTGAPAHGDAELEATPARSGDVAPVAARATPHADLTRDATEGRRADAEATPDLACDATEDGIDDDAHAGEQVLRLPEWRPPRPAA